MSWHYHFHCSQNHSLVQWIYETTFYRCPVRTCGKQVIGQSCDDSTHQCAPFRLTGLDPSLADRDAFALVSKCEGEPVMMHPERKREPEPMIVEASRLDRLAVATWNVHHLGEIALKTTEHAKHLNTVLQYGKVIKRRGLAPAGFADWERDDFETQAALLETFGNKDALRELDTLGDQKLCEKWAAALRTLEDYLGQNKNAADGQRRTKEKLEIAAACARAFRDNAWLDALILQEVRSGIDIIERKLADFGSAVKLLRGPLLVSSGGREHGQEEYYPIIYRTERIQCCYYWGSVSTDGTRDRANRVTWEKSEGTYRPTVVYEFKLKARPDVFRIGVVHTTPGEATTEETKSSKRAADDELQREDQYQQVKKLFEKVSGDDAEFCRTQSGAQLHWIIGGDYYIGLESQIRGPAVGLGTGAYDSIAQHEVFNDLSIENRADRALQQLGKNVTTISEALGILSENKAFVGKDVKRANGLLKKANDWPANSERYKRILRMLKLKLWANLVRRAMGESEQLLSTGGLSAIRHEAQLSFASCVPSGLEVLQTVSGTNWHTKRALLEGLPMSRLELAKVFATARIADFFVITKTFTMMDEDGAVSQTGILHPQGGFLLADTEDLSVSKYWIERSDHFPVVCYLALDRSAATNIRSAIRNLRVSVFQREDLKSKIYAWRLFRIVELLDGFCMVKGLAEIYFDISDEGIPEWIQNWETVREDRVVKLDIRVELDQLVECVDVLRKRLLDVLQKLPQPSANDGSQPDEIGFLRFENLTAEDQKKIRDSLRELSAELTDVKAEMFA